MNILEFGPRIFSDFAGDYRPIETDSGRLSLLARISLVAGTSFALCALAAVLAIHVIHVI